MASISDAHTIVLNGDYGKHDEGILSGAASPGMNLAMTTATESMGRHIYAAGGTDNVGTGTGITTTAAPIKIVKEDALQGKTVDDAYVTGDNVFFYEPLPGDVLQVLVTSGQTVTKGSGLSAASTGKWVSDSTNVAVESLEDSAGALGADTLMRVRVL